MDSDSSKDVFGNELRQQKRELAVLNAIIQTVSDSYNLKETLAKALEMVLSVVDSPTGWICLVDEKNTCSAFVGHKGFCFQDEDGKPPPCLVHCVCDRVRKTKDVVIINALRQGCPLLHINNQQGRAIIGHVSIPLMTKSRVVGQLSVAFHDGKQADSMDIELLRAITPQLAVAVENARLWDEVQEKEELRKKLLKRVVTAHEEERGRISRELHDELGQELTSLLVRLQVMENGQPDIPNHALISGMKNTVSQLLTSIHDLALELRPTTLDDLGLAPAVTQYAKNCPEYLGIEVDVEIIGMENQRLPREVETNLYRIIQESLTNVARHSGAARASVLLRKNGKSISVIIEDKGVGFDLKDSNMAQGKKNRLGLYGMEERVSLIEGTFVIESAPGAGTTIYIEVPVE